MSSHKDNRIKAIISLSRKAFGKYKSQIVILTVLGFLGGFLEGIGINAIIPLFSFVSGDSMGTAGDLISKLIENFFSFLHITFSVKYLLIFICLLFIFRAIALVLFSYIKIKITADYEEKMRGYLFSQTIEANWPYLLKQKIGYLETVLMTDVSRASMLLEKIGTVIMALTSLSVYTFVAINISLQITLMTFVLGGVLFLFLKPLIYKTRATAYEVADINKQVAHHINENITGMKTVKVMHASDSILRISKQYFSKLKNLRVRIFLLKNITGAFVQPVSLVFICVLFAFSYKTPDFSFAALAAIIYLVQRIFTYIQQLQTDLHVTNEMIPFLISVLDHEEQSLKHKEDMGGKENFEFNKKLELKNIDFSYISESKVLANLNLEIKKGEMIGLIGPSGAGKTTVVDLILRLLKPKKGEILLDNKNINNIGMEEWRKNIGYVSQDIFLMNDTIENNIKFYNKSVTKKDIEEAAKQAQIYDFIQDCPDKLSTIIGERGVKLSAGQRQRIIIARILAKKPKFLILDEATSALDSESEVKIQKVIESLKGKITVLVIAHRLSTIINSDRLLVLEKGKIVERGSAQELLKNKESYFYKVYNIRK